MYKCAKCGATKTEIGPTGLQCDQCGGKIFYKIRPNVKKTLKAR